MLPNPQFPADSVTSAEEILTGKFYFLCNDYELIRKYHYKKKKYRNNV